jgi:hypothetical protein
MSAQSFPPPPADLQQKLRAAMASEPEPQRTRIGPRIALGITIAVLGAVSVSLRMRPDAAEISATWFFSTIAGALVLAIVAVALSMLPGKRGLGSPVTWLAVVVTLTPAIYAAITMIAPMKPPDAISAFTSFAEVVKGAWPCFLMSVGVGGFAGIGLLWALRNAVAVAPRLRGAALGAAAGAWSGLALHIHCPMFERGHIMVGHFVPILIFAIVGALVGPRVLKT